MTKLRILLATVLLSLTFGGILGRKYFTYVLFVAIEPILYPCPYSDIPKGSFTHAPSSHTSPPPRSQPGGTVGQPKTTSVQSPSPAETACATSLFFDHLPPPQPIDN